MMGWNDYGWANNNGIVGGGMGVGIWHCSFPFLAGDFYWPSAS